MSLRRLYNPAGTSLDDVSFPRPYASVTLRSDATALNPSISEMTVPQNECSAPFSPHSCRLQGTLASTDLVDMASISR
ncbi:hypothetical protein N7471_013374 [Penicillium samsonianum]|uniref:uncharacterized protein n=1 Tax=Penicillium samsonianum TaxID=1882272 RepID=UPI0025498C8D|nr:uncharacterized protein N7471_013374 [Penicillium samsonianum]KAJ6118754.1 hypothetical protein N7471_013374 [Penicillium samsonianum]